MNIALTVQMPRIGERLLLATVWTVLVGLTWVYWETCRMVHGATGLDLRQSGLWMVEIWSGWLVLSFPACDYCRRWRNDSAGISLTRVLGLVAALFILSLCCEWVLNLVLSRSGGIERWESGWAMFNRRALLSVLVSGALVSFAIRPKLSWRSGAQPVTPVASAGPEISESELVVMDRGRAITVALNDVEAILAAENYVLICLVNGKEYLHRMTLARIEQQLDGHNMLRVHRSALVNVDKTIGRLPGWTLQLASGRKVRVGRSFKDVVDQRLQR